DGITYRAGELMWGAFSVHNRVAGKADHFPAGTYNITGFRPGNETSDPGAFGFGQILLDGNAAKRGTWLHAYSATYSYGKGKHKRTVTRTWLTPTFGCARTQNFIVQHIAMLLRRNGI